MKLIIWPGLAMQKLTTREPTLDMLEVAIHALAPVLAADGLELPATEADAPSMATPQPGLATSS
jgi:uncharacterized protein YqhQ